MRLINTKPLVVRYAMGDVYHKRIHTWWYDLDTAGGYAWVIDLVRFDRDLTSRDRNDYMMKPNRCSNVHYMGRPKWST